MPVMAQIEAGQLEVAGTGPLAILTSAGGPIHHRCGTRRAIAHTGKFLRGEKHPDLCSAAEVKRCRFKPATAEDISSHGTFTVFQLFGLPC
jgi:hypothetical protein